MILPPVHRKWIPDSTWMRIMHISNVGWLFLRAHCFYPTPVLRGNLPQWEITSVRYIFFIRGCCSFHWVWGKFPWSDIEKLYENLFAQWIRGEDIYLHFGSICCKKKPYECTTVNFVSSYSRECENHQNFVGPADRHIQYFVGPANFLSVRHKIT